MNAKMSSLLDQSALTDLADRLVAAARRAGADAADALACAICHAHGGLGVQGEIGRRRRAGRILVSPAAR